MPPKTEVVVESSFEAAEQATKERMARLSPEERLKIYQQLLRQIYPDDLLDSRIQGTVEVFQR